MMGPKPPHAPSGKHNARLKAPIKPQDSKGTFRRLLNYLQDSWKRLLVVFFAVTISTIITIVGTRLSGVAVDHYIMTGDLTGLAIICVIMLIMYLLSTIANYAQQFLMIDMAQNISAQLRSQLFNRLLTLPLTFFDTHNSGDLMSRLTNDVDNVNTTLSQNITQFFSGVINVGGMFIAMVILSPRLTAFAMLVIPLTLLVSKIIIKLSRRYFSQYQRSLGQLNGYIEEMISGSKVVLLFHQQKHVAKEFAAINDKLQRNFALAQTFSAMGPFMSFINNLIYVLITLLGAYFIMQGHLTVGVVFTFLLYMRNFSRPLNSLADLFNTIQSALAGAERIFEIIDEPPEKDWQQAQELSFIRGDIMARSVNFGYTPNQLILKEASFSVKAGQTVAIVGPTGAGKTTIISLLTGFYRKNGGELLIDGQDIDQITRRSLRSAIGIVLQDTFLFSESIMDNIRYGRLNATEAEVIEAAKLANAHNFIMQLEQGYHTLLTEGGQNLSQGQRQLIAIARAILADPALLILDEATSSIDTRTEMLIQESLLRLMKGRTSFVIAHRLSTIKTADQILVVNDGRIVESGTHQSLLAQKGFYHQLYQSQFSG